MTKLSSSTWVCAIFTVAFFAMLYSLGMSTMIVTVETIVTSFMDTFPRMRARRPLVVYTIIFVLFLIGLPMVTEKGQYWFTIFDTYSASYSLVISAMVEMLAASWVYGLDRISSDIKMMTGQTLPKFFRVMWAYITPAVLTITLAFNIWKHSPSTASYYEIKYPFPAKCNVLAVFLVFTPIVMMVGLCLRELANNDWSWAAATRPTNHWGPLKDDDRLEYNKERQDGLVYQRHSEIESKPRFESKALKS